MSHSRPLGLLKYMTIYICVFIHYADIDECSHGNYTCQENAECSNVMGGYECVCRDGYERTDNNSCIGM